MLPTQPMRRFARGCVAAAVLVVGAGILGLDALWCLAVATLLLLLAGIVALIAAEQRQYSLRDDALQDDGPVAPIEISVGMRDAVEAEPLPPPAPPAPPAPIAPPIPPLRPSLPSLPEPPRAAPAVEPRRAAVRFALPGRVGAEQVHLVGDFNDWSPTSTPMEREGDSFAVRLELEVGRSYRYRFLLDGERWENDWAAERYLPNAFGSEDSVVTVSDAST